MMIRIEFSKSELERLVRDEIARRLGDIPVELAFLNIETRSKQNYRSEWEMADYRAVYQVVK